MTRQNRKIQIAHEEHEALCYLRDVEHERVKLLLLEAQANYRACLSINSDQCARLCGQDLQLADLRAKLIDMQGRAQAAEARVRDLSPATLSSSRDQPLFAKSELKR